MHQQVCVQLLRTLTTWHCPHSHAAAAAIDRHLLLAGPTAANLNYILTSTKLQQVCVQLLCTLTTWHCPHSPAAAATIDWHLLPAGPTAANLQRRVCICYLQLAHAGTDGRTPYRFIDAAPHTMRTVQIITAVPHAYNLVYRVAQQSRCLHTTAHTVLHRFSKFLQPKISNNIIIKIKLPIKDPNTP